MKLKAKARRSKMNLKVKVGIFLSLVGIFIVISGFTILVGLVILRATEVTLKQIPVNEEPFKVEIAEMFIDPGETICFELKQKMHFEVHSLVMTEEFPVWFVNYAMNYDPAKHKNKWCVRDSSKKTLVRVLTDLSLEAVSTTKTVNKEEIDMERFDRFLPEKTVSHDSNIENPTIFSGTEKK